MAITNKGRGWELANSLWLILAAIPYCAWIYFLVIGSKAKQLKWVLFGALHLAVQTGLLIGCIFGGKPLSGVFIALLVLYWPASMVHAFLTRKEFLLRWEVVVANKDAKDKEYRQKILGDYVPPPPRPESTPKARVNLNTATEQELSSLPGVSVAMAKRALEARAQSGFASARDFNQRLGLMPHFAAQIEALAYAEPVPMPLPDKPPSPQSAGPGRVIDF